MASKPVSTGGGQREPEDGSLPSSARASTIADDRLPVDSLRDALPYLRRPFTPEAIKFKVQAVFAGNSGCLIVAYIDARLVIERLNLVCPDLWAATYQPIDGSKLMWCHLTLGTPKDRGFGGEITRSDVGESPKGLSKDLVSDSLKRAAVHFGVGVSVYALAQVRIMLNESRGRIELRGKAPKETLALTDTGLEWLRGGYRRWLDSQTNFGPPLDHGDVEGAGGVEAEPEPEDAFVPEAPAPLEDDRAKGLVAEAEAVYAEIQKLGESAVRAVPPGQFHAWLTGAAHSHGELERLVGYLKSRRDQLAAS